MKYYGLTTFYLRRLAKAPFLRQMKLASALMRNAIRLAPFYKADVESHVGRLVDARPEILDVLVTRFVASCWKPQTRIERALDHVRIVEEIGGVVDFYPNSSIELMRLHDFDSRYSLVLDQARWQISEGLLVLSLWDGQDRIYSLSFIFGSDNLMRVVYVGGIQGAKLPDVMTRYREFTKAAFGMRPRDFLIEMLRNLCVAFDVREIRGVSSDNHVSQEKRSMGSASDCEIKLSYDDVWIERGGRSDGAGFYSLTPEANRRDLLAVPPKKRSVYRKRYDALDQMEKNILSTFSADRKKYVATDWFRSAKRIGRSLGRSSEDA